MINRPIVGENVFFDGAYSSGFDFLLSFSLSLAKPFPFTCLVLLPAFSGLFLRKLVAGGETYAPEAEVPFLSSLVSSPSQKAAKDLWSSRMPPGAEAQVQSKMAERAPRFMMRLRRSAGSTLILSKRRRCNGLRAAVNVVRSIPRSDATSPRSGSAGRLRDIISENWPLVSPIERSALSKPRASALSGRKLC